MMLPLMSRRFISFLGLIQLVTVVAATTSSAVADDAFTIKLSRLTHVGDQWAEQAKVTHELSKRWTDPGDARKPINEKFEASLDGLFTVDAVSANGRATEVSVKLKSCTKDGAELLPAGTIITAKNRHGRSEFQVNGQPASDDVKKVLDSLVHTARPDEPTLDDEAGTDQPRKVGDSWPTNGDQMAKATMLPFKVTGKDINGEATLKSVSTKDGQQSETVTIGSVCRFDTRPGKDGSSFNDMAMLRHWTVTVPVEQKSNSSALQGDFVVTYTFVDSTGKLEVAAKDTFESACADAGK